MAEHPPVVGGGDTHDVVLERRGLERVLVRSAYGATQAPAHVAFGVAVVDVVFGCAAPRLERRCEPILPVGWCEVGQTIESPVTGAMGEQAEVRVVSVGADD